MGVTKSGSKATANPGDQITFTLNVVNSGAGDAAPVSVTIDGGAVSKIVVRDIIPNNTRFSGFVSTGGATPLYPIFSAPLQSYVSTGPGNLATVEPAAFALD